MSATVRADGPGSAGPIFLSPHFDDVALSCGGTVAAAAEAGRRPRIVTLFGGVPAGPLSEFARFQHARWGLDPVQAVQQRREEELAAAKILGAEAAWLDFPDAIYRDARYTSDDALFGPIHPSDAPLVDEVTEALSALASRRDQPRDDEGCKTRNAGRIFVPLAIGNHVDHQLALLIGERLADLGDDVLAYEDFPYAGDPDHAEERQRRATAISCEPPLLRRLSDAQLRRRIDAILCYRSQLRVIFRHQGDPAESTRRYAARVGDGRPAERFWQVGA